MGMIFNPADLTMNPQEAMAFSQFVFDLARNYDSITSLHDFRTGVAMKEQIGIVGKMGKTGKKMGATCTVPESGATINMAEKFWEPALIADKLEICPREVNGLFKPYFSKIATVQELFDVQLSDAWMVIGLRIAEALQTTQWRAIWHGDTAIAAATTTAVGLSAAANIDFYNYFDGIWKQVFAAVTAGDTPRITIAENALTTNALRTTLARGRATAILREMYRAATPELRSSPQGRIYATRWLFDEYVADRQAVSDAFMPERTEDGMLRVRFEGIDLYSTELIDSEYFADVVEDTTDDFLFRPLRAIYTYSENLPVATLEGNALSETKYWFSNDKNKGFLQYAFTLDAKLVLDNQAVAAY